MLLKPTFHFKENNLVVKSICCIFNFEEKQPHHKTLSYFKAYCVGYLFTRCHYHWNIIPPSDSCMISHIIWMWFFLLTNIYIRSKDIDFIMKCFFSISSNINDFVIKLFLLNLVCLTQLCRLLSFFLSFGLATEVPKLTHYGVVLFHPRA